MKPIESAAEFTAFVAAAGLALDDCSPREGLEQMLSFYEGVNVGNCDGPDSDMLLFQWGTYDWGSGKHFELNITRQFIEEEREGDDAISQLSLTFKFEPTAEIELLGAENRWCVGAAELENFRAFVFSSAPLLAIADSKARLVELNHSYV